MFLNQGGALWWYPKFFNKNLGTFHLTKTFHPYDLFDNISGQLSNITHILALKDNKVTFNCKTIWNYSFSFEDSFSC